jgi:hypothetical protein
MTRTLLFFCLAGITTSCLQAQEKKNTKWLKGMYFQWGYNTERYTRSNIHFKMSNGDNFTLRKAKAHDSRDYNAILEKPLEISIPQYNYRFGFYLDKQHRKAIEINFDHAKYIVTDWQKVRVTGTINGKTVDGDSILDRNSFLHFEHTDGANWLHINYVQQTGFVKNKARTRDLLTYVWKAGAGINIPRTDFTWKGDRLNNNFHVAGYNISAEAGVRLYMFKKIFFETTGKTGYVKYINALANTATTKGNRAVHSFGYIEAIATLGFDIGF